MTFTDFSYRRPDMSAFSKHFRQLLTEFREAASAEYQQHAFQQINEARNEFLSMYNLCYIRHTVNTLDPFYEAENNFFDQHLPDFEALNFEFYQGLTKAAFRPQLEDTWGPQLFRIAECNLKTFHPDIIPDLQEENTLKSAYLKLKATAAITCQGNTYNLSSIIKLETDPDRHTRQEAADSKWAFFDHHQQEFDRIFDQLVSVRHRIATRLGFNNFTELAYARMLRTDYSPNDIAAFRAQIRSAIVPLASRLFEQQRQHIALDTLRYFDEEFKFPEGNPKPQGDEAWIVQQAADMYRELSPETHAFFSLMQEQQLMDLPARPGKAPGGYCTFINQPGLPFIFSNFNGTSGDIDVLTHEIGHAFQVFSSRHIGINEYNWPTYEACEIHSMSMELFTYPWMDRFFGPDTDNYRYSHLAAAICFLPYGCAVDEFQHLVYEHPDWSPQQRHQAWLQLEKTYLPHRNNEGNKFLESGGFWLKQNHIFASPFYYIDYVLAQICAFQFWIRDRNNHHEAWSDYLRLCREGGRLPFLQLVELAGLQSPFQHGTVEQVAQAVAQWLDEQHP
jgi:M3 family oligoendopeptidase